MYPSANLSRQSISTRLVSNDKNNKYIQNPNNFESEIKPIQKKPKIDNENKSKPLNNVIVLADNKNYSREFLKCLGMSVGSPFLCTKHIPTKMFTFQIYGIEESDEKIFNHVKTNAGLIIITSLEEYEKLLKPINFYCENISHIPILIVLENCIGNQNSEPILKNKINKSNVKYEFLDKKFNHSSYLQGSLNYNKLGLHNLEWFNSYVKSFKPLPTNLLSLEELVKQFVDCKLSIENWNHFNRLRLVYFSLKNFGYDKTIDQNEWLCVKWNQYKNTIGHSHLWNYTLTKFWIQQIFSLMLNNPKMDFAQLYSNFSHLSDGNLHKKYYSNELLFSDKARKEWVNPDLV
jgi:hypothetical protein